MGECKIILAEEFCALRKKLKQEQKKTALCHGVFDLLHPGHISHLQEAKGICDVLIVSITAAPFVNRGPGRPYFSDELRMRSLAALGCVDYVLLAEGPTAMTMIDLVQPDFYVKGQEYATASEDVTGNIEPEIARVRSYGGDVYFTGGEVFSSTKLLNNSFQVFPPGVKEFAKDFSRETSFEKLRELVDGMAKSKVLVIGDIIMDEYVFCSVQGLMSKDRAFSALYQREERYLGGSLAVARHLAAFAGQVTLCAMTGDEADLLAQMRQDLSGKVELVLHSDPAFRTPVKRRFLEKHGLRDEYEKLFSINYLPELEAEKHIDRKPFYCWLAENVEKYDLVVVTDYGHGLLDEESMEIIQTESAYLAVNCQTNSANFGTNLITKYKRADIFTLDERELRLALADSREEYGILLNRLAVHLDCKMGWVTLGSAGSLAINANGEEHRTPALTLTVQDTVGAGDAFYALVALAAQQGADLKVASLLGNVAGAMAANIMGNAKEVEKGALLKFATTLLKF